MNSKLTTDQQIRQQQQYEDLSSVNKNNITSTSLSSVERQKASRREKDRERKNLAHTKRNEDTLEIRTPSTIEEEKKTARREKDRERKKQKQIQKLADLRAYEELCANARKMHSERPANLQEEQIVHGNIPIDLQWNTNQIEVERERLRLESIQRAKDSQRDEAKHRQEDNAIRRLKRKAEKEEQERERLQRMQREKDRRRDEAKQRKEDNERERLEIIRREKDRRRDEVQLQRKEDKEKSRLKQKAEKEEQERERIRLYHELDAEGHFFSSLPIQLNPLIEFKQFTTPKRPNPKNQLRMNEHNKGETGKFEDNQNPYYHHRSSTSNIDFTKPGTHHNLRQKKLSFIEEEEEEEEEKETSSANFAKDIHLEPSTVIIEVSEDEEEEQQHYYPIIDLSYAITIEDVFSGPSNNETLHINNYAVITRQDLLTLKESTWLNDEVINFYMHMLLNRDCKLSEQNNTMLRSWFTTTNFFVKLLDGRGQYHYNSVRKWTKHFDIFSADKILIPINITNTHWTLLVFYVLLKEVHYSASMSREGDRYIKNGLRWLADEIMNKKGIAIDINEWKRYQQEDHVPQQNNGYDCGMFVLMCARAIAYNQPLSSYNQRDMQRYRYMIGRQILQGSLVDFTDQSVPYMFQLTPELEPAKSHKTATESLNFGTSLRRKRNTSSTQRQLCYTHVQPQKSLFSMKLAEAAIEKEDSEDSEKSDGNVSQRQLPYTHVQPQWRSLFSTKTAETAFEEEDSEDSEENNADNMEPKIEETKYNPYKSHVHVNMSIFA